MRCCIRAPRASPRAVLVDLQWLDAATLQAIHSAHSDGFVNHEAIAYELAARFYATRGFQKFADAYWLEARYCYQRWGADRRVAWWPDLGQSQLLTRCNISVHPAHRGQRRQMTSAGSPVE